MGPRQVVAAGLTGLTITLTACSVTSEARPLPVDAIATALANETSEIEFSYQEMVRENYDRHAELTGQPFPSGGPKGSRAAGGAGYHATQDLADGSIAFEITPPRTAIQLPNGVSDDRVRISFVAEWGCNASWAYSSPVIKTIDQERGEREVAQHYEDPEPDDPICTFIWPGILAQRILPPEATPTTLDEYFTNLADHPFIYSHSIRIAQENVSVYQWKTETNNINEIREIGINNDNEIYYINWWRSEPHEGENVNHRVMQRICTGTCD